MSRIVVVLLVIASAVFGRDALAVAIFSDSFTAGSTLNPGSYPTPTSTTTGYDILSTKAATTAPFLTSGTLRLKLNAATNSGVIETQATTPNATLTNPGDILNYTVTFFNTNDLLAYSTGTATPNVGSFLYFGIYNNGGSTPVVLNNSGLNTTAGSLYATGNAANWKGYVSKIGSAIAGTGTSTSQMYTRPLQSGAGTTSANQEVLVNGASGGTYNNPAGTTISGNAIASTLAPLTNGSQYTYEMAVTLAAGGTQTFVSSLYAGSSATGSPLWTQSGTAATPLTNTYNAFAFGYRTASASPSSLNPTMDVTSVTLTVVPEPTTMTAAAAMAGLTFLMWRRRREN